MSRLVSEEELLEESRRYTGLEGGGVNDRRDLRQLIMRSCIEPPPRRIAALARSIDPFLRSTDPIAREVALSIETEYANRIAVGGGTTDLQNDELMELVHGWMLRLNDSGERLE